VAGLSGWVLLAAGCSAPDPGGPAHPALLSTPEPTVAALVLRERFGVAHPRQLVEFDLPAAVGPGPFRVLKVGGGEVPSQVLASGRLTLLTDLPAFGDRRWTVSRAAHATPLANGVRIVAHHTYYEVTNGLTGVRLPRFSADLSRVPAPVQGLRLLDGTWTATGPNHLLDAAGRPLVARAAAVRFLERGPLRVVAEVAYLLRGPDDPRGDPTPPRHYRATIEIQAGQPVVLVEDEAEVTLQYRLDVTRELHPDQARYRGHHATSAELGREPDGRRYRAVHERPPMDAVVDLPPGGPALRGPVAVWDPWIVNGGWYWQLYDSGGPPEANLLGVFAGRASRALGARESGLRVYAEPRGTGRRPTVGLVMELNRRGSDGSAPPWVRVSWGAFVGARGRDLALPGAVQPIARQMNLHAGINLGKLHPVQRAAGTVLDGRLGFYLDPRGPARLVERVRHDEAYRRWLRDADPTARPLLELWRDPTPERRREIVDAIVREARELLDALVHGDGIYDGRAFYWHGGLAMTRLVPWMNALSVDPETTPEDRERISAIAILFATILWDDDLVPLFPGHGLHLGTENMPVQQWEYRSQYALLLGRDPALRARASAVARAAVERLHAVVDESGAHMSSPHYVGASMGPLLTTLQQLGTSGVDLFAEEPRLRRFAEFYLNLLTPPEMRFGGRRKLVSIGDGSTESSELFGQLGTGFGRADPVLGARLMGAWRASGSPHSGFHGTSILKIDDDRPGRNPGLGSTTFPTWYSVLRSGWGTLDESAVWLVHGTTYRDHYHDDNGSLVIYALGAPVTLDWGSTYAPRVAGAAMHNLVLPEALLGHPWNRSGTPLDAGARWTVEGRPRFVALRHSSLVAADYRLPGYGWHRRVELIHHDPARPVLRIRDRLHAADPRERMVLSLGLAATGQVETPTGARTPPHVDPGRLDPPSAGPVFDLAAGWTTLGFAGQWGVDWDLHVSVPRPARAQVGEWAHRWHPTREAVEFQQAHGRPFEERQHILRILGEDAFDLLLLPYRRAAGGAGVDVHESNGGTELTSPGWRLWLVEGGHVFRDGRRTVVTATGESPMSGEGVTLAGGTVEVTLEDDTVSVVLHGEPGARRIFLPEDCELDGVQGSGQGRWRLDYDGSAPVEIHGRCGALRTPSNEASGRG
jgi:hypothetical protein